MHRTLMFVLGAIVFAGTLFLVLHLNPSSMNFKTKEGERGRSEALEALDFWTRSRAYPDIDIPPNKYYRAYQQSKLKHSFLPIALTAGSIWDPIGPLNLQGRALCVAVNPLNSNTLYVGTASGGLWRSFTAGMSGDWQQLQLGYAALGISSILIDPIDSNTIYIGTGEVYGYQTSVGGLVVRTTRGSYGIGILKTTNGGNAWTKSIDWSYDQQRGVQCLKFNPSNRHSIWAATTEGIFRSINDGSGWEQLNSTLLAEDIVINSLDTNLILASFGDLNSPGTGVYKSADGGSIWNIVTGLPPYTGKTLFSEYAANPQIVYASVADSTTDAGGLWRTTDFGDNWAHVLDATNLNLYQVQGWYSHYVVVHPSDSNQIVYSAVRRSKSNDGGQSFHDVATGYADNHGYAIDPNNPNVLYAANDDGIYRSSDFGDSYVNIGYGMQSGQFYNGFSCSASDSLLALGQSQDHIPGYRYLGGLDWDHRSASDEAGWTAINQWDDNIQYAVSRFGQSILRSTNRGSSFVTVVYPGGTGAWNSPIVVSQSDQEILFMADTKIHKTTNSGTDWTNVNGDLELDNNPVLSLAVSATNPNMLCAGTAPMVTRSHVFVSTNGGTSWSDATKSLPDRYPIDMCFDPQSLSTVYLTFGGFGSGHVFKLTNFDSSWTDVTGTLPDVPTTAVVVDPLNSNIVYVGNDLGVYVSTDAGGTWSSFKEGLPDAVIVADLTISPSNRSLRVATHGNGIWERKLLNELPPNYFDYKVTKIDYPAGGRVDTVGASYASLRATFRNLSAQAQTDSFDVKFRILHASTELYSKTKRVSGLGFAESRQVSFDGAFVPGDTATYTLQAICKASDQNVSDDTLSELLTIVSRPNIRNWTVSKVATSYVEIAGGSPGPSGDDAQKRAAIPFTFSFDGYGYDSVQISTNGWLELGTGTPGSFRGLSTASQIGGYFTPTLATTDRPTKVLGPWWTDLSTNGSIGQITYTTLNSAPNRVFVAQWKHILAYYDAGQTSTYLNFQIKLYETTNIVEFCYGPVTVGAYPLGATGASMGLKDYIGGDFRFYDLSRYASGRVGNLRTNLSPITDWPGQDSVFRINTNIGTSAVSSDRSALPLELTLDQNYPNPFNPATTISYNLTRTTDVRLVVYDILGQEVETLIPGRQEAGLHSVRFDASNLPSGIYIYNLIAGKSSMSKKMLLIR